MLPLLASSRAYDVVVFGENSLDFVARTMGDGPVAGKQALERFETLPGGQGATAAIGCARLGSRVRYIGAFGAGDWGVEVRHALTLNGVDVLALEREGARQRIAVIVVDPTGERLVFEHRDPKLALDDPGLAVAAACEARIVLVDATDIRASIAIARGARAAGARVVVDVDRIDTLTAELLAEIDVIIVPEDFVRTFTGADRLEAGLLAIANRFKPAAVVATQGPAGSLALTAGRTIRTPAFEVPVVDTTGAGDAFRAGFCSAWSSLGPSAEIDQVLAYANAAAALNCQARGAQAGLPTMGTIEALVTSGRSARSNQ
jgi:sugar/nucleoside kinase (ribokinase family)